MKQFIQLKYLSGLFVFLGSTLFFMAITDRKDNNSEPWVVLALSDNNEVSQFYPELPKIHDQINFYSWVGRGNNFYMATSASEFQQLSQLSRSVCSLSRSLAQVQIYYCIVDTRSEKQNPLKKRVFDN